MSILRKIMAVVLFGTVLSVGAKTLGSDWDVVFDSFRNKVIIEENGYSLYRGTFTVSNDPDFEKHSFTAATLNNEIDLLVVSKNGETIEPSLKYDIDTKEFYYGKRKNKVSKTVRSDSTHTETIRSGIEIWLDLKEE